MDPSTPLPRALAMREALRLGEVTSGELVREALERVEAGRSLGSFVSLNAQLALEEAAAADERIAAARSSGSTAAPALPPLLGMPTAHKDLVDVRGVATTHGSLAVAHLIAEADDPIAAAVRSAGAVSIGKTQVPEFGIAGYSENEVAPPARNPYDPSRTAGGSSGGTAAAIAAGLIPAAIASDAGGSIRIPAAACGLIGLKPGRGVVPADRAAAAASPRTALDEAGAPRMGVSGPIASSARDAALLFDAICRGPVGHADQAPGATDEPALSAVQRVLDDPSLLRGLNIGVSLASPFETWAEIRFDESALEALGTGVAALQAAGHSVHEAAFEYDPNYPEAFTTVWTAALARIPFEPGAENGLGELARMFLERARSTPADRLSAAAAALRGFAAEAARQWGEYDIVLTPALAFAAPRIGEFRSLGPEGDYRLQCEWSPQTSMVNVAGLPAVTVPTLRASDSPDGLPMGVQLIGRAGSESVLLQLAAQLTGT